MLALLAGLFAWPAGVCADAASGRWSGTLEGRGNYYWETSTRVIVPDVQLDVESPGGTRLGAGYLVDVISSASIAQGAEEDEVFTELRHGVEASIGHEIELGGAHLDLSARSSYSTEDDYTSRIYGLASALSWNERNSRVDLGVSLVSDDIRANNDPDFRGELDGITLGASFEQLLSPTLVLVLGYQLAMLDGFLGNAYRSVQLGAAPIRESPPEQRTRHNGAAQLKIFIPVTDSALHLRYRAYIDSWDLGALTPELRFYQHLGDSFMLRAEYRFYTQTSVDFIGGGGLYPMGYDGPTTNDPKLDEMQTHTMTFGAELRADFLGGSFLDFAKGTWIDLQITRYLSTSTFGNGVIASAGARLPF